MWFARPWRVCGALGFVALLMLAGSASFTCAQCTLGCNEVPAAWKNVGGAQCVAYGTTPGGRLFGRVIYTLFPLDAGPAKLNSTITVDKMTCTACGDPCPAGTPYPRDAVPMTCGPAVPTEWYYCPSAGNEEGPPS